jgi:hypothetical protein
LWLQFLERRTEPIPQFRVTAKLCEFLEARFSQSFSVSAAPAGPPIFITLFFLVDIARRTALSDPLISQNFIASLRPPSTFYAAAIADHDERPDETASHAAGIERLVSSETSTPGTLRLQIWVAVAGLMALDFIC